MPRISEDLIQAALQAEDEYDLDELERYADAQRIKAIYRESNVLAAELNHVLRQHPVSGILSYRYKISEDTTFQFHALSEVGEPYQPWFEYIIKELKLIVTTNADGYDVGVL